VFVGFARDLVALLWVGVVSGNGAVSPQHASDVVVEPWARILNAYAPRETMEFESDIARHSDRGVDGLNAVQVDAEELRRWIGRLQRVVQRQTL